MLRRELLTGAAALAAYAALGTDPASAAPFIVGTGVSGGAVGELTTPAINTTGATLIVLTQGYYPLGGSEAPTDNKSNTYTLITSLASGYGFDMYYCLNPNVGSGHTFSNAEINYGFLNAAAYSGTVASSVLDSACTNSANNSSATTLAAGSVTPSQSNTLLVAAVLSDNGTGVTTYTINDSYTLRVNTVPVPATSQGGGIADLWIGAAAAQNPTWDGLLNAGQISAIIAGFKMTSGPPGGSTPSSLTLLGVGP